MAYIVPSGTIRICKNVPLNNTYRDTILFESATEQFSYFLGKAKYTLDDYTYMRVNQAIRVEIKADDLYDCNYIVFRNNSFGTKYFYAFITKITYINNETSEIQYELDVLQTWHFDYQLKQCFVEREHSETDEPGDNTVPENLETGEMLYGTSVLRVPEVTEEYRVVIASAVNESGQQYVPILRRNIVSCLGFEIFNSSDTQGIYNFIHALDQKGKSGAIVSIFMCPASYLNDTKVDHTLQRQDFYKNIDGYIPKNKKLFCYPYNYLMGENGNGAHAVYHLELFTSDSMYFVSDLNYYSCDPALVLWPRNYRKNIDDYVEKLTVNGFPQVAYNCDSFVVQLAQNVASLPLFNFSSVLQGAAFSPSPVMGVISGALSNLESTGKMLIGMSKQPPITAGVSGGSTNFVLGENRISIYNVHIKAEYAKIIDDYFNAYGYACHKVKVPNRSSRPCWNYVKTVNCNAIGSVPVEDMRKICSIYDNGITWWKQGENIGNYDLDNSPA